MGDKKIESPAAASFDSDYGRFTNQNETDLKDAKSQEPVVVIDRLAGSDTASASTDDSNPFSDPDVAAYYATLYEKSQYECRDVFDPTFEWSAAEEKKLVRKLDWHVCLWAVSLLNLSDERK